MAPPNGDLIFSLVGEICGSPIHSNGRRKLASRSPRTGCGIARLQAVAFRTSPVNATPFLAGYRINPAGRSSSQPNRRSGLGQIDREGSQREDERERARFAGRV